jgi:UDP-N-acetylmuramoyl-L-alanyl-D-glutamate--2,6-diaminopimelate ligase
VAAFTNLSQDHLDFHGTMEAYQSAKESLFRDYEVGTAVINVTDPIGEVIAGWYRGRAMTVGAGGDLTARGVQTSFHGTDFELAIDTDVIPVRSSLIGDFNVENALVAAGCCLALGLTLEQVAAGLGGVTGVPGRFELVSGNAPVHVVVDYAHTPAGVEKAIEVARAIGRGRIIALVGAGGDRDREKRPLMGAAASTADLAVITSDNPRSEDPGEIIDQVAAGAGGSGDLVLETDRRRAIELAIGAAHNDDVVLILGKGHETGQEVDGEVYAFDDRLVARDVLGSGRKSANSGPVSGSMGP